MELLVRKDAGKVIIYDFSSGRFSLYNEHVLPIIKTNSNFLNNERCFISQQEHHRLKPYKDNSFDASSFSGPLVTGIMLSNYCNLFCRYCIAYYGGGYSQKNTIEKNTDKLISNLLDSKVIGVLISGGEPTLSPVLPILLKTLSTLPFYITLDTNGVLLPDAVKKVLISSNKIIPRISLDSHIESIHNKNRGHFIETKATILSLLSSGVDVRINTVLHRDNCECLLDFGKYLISIGIKKWHIFKLQPQFAPKYLKIDDELAQETISELKNTLGDKINIICKFTKDNDGFASFVVDSDMNCFSTDNSNKCIFGNMNDNSMRTIWNNTNKTYRENHIKKYIKLQ